MRMRFTSRRFLLFAAFVWSSLLLAPKAQADNVALGKTAFASWNNATAINVTDNNFGTAWDDTGSPTVPSDTIGVDLGAPTAIKTVRIFWSTQPVDWTLDTATSVITDPTDPNFGSGDWTTQYPPTSPVPTLPNPTVIDLTSKNLTARFIRINGIDAPGAWGIQEFQVYNVALANVTGTVKFGATTVPNSLLTLTGPNGSTAPITAQAKSGATGAYTFTGLEPGVYNLRALAPGQYAPVNTTVTITTGNATQDITFTQAVNNFTAPLPAYNLDFIASDAAPGDSNTASGGQALPAEQVPTGPTGDADWNTGGALPAGTLAGPDLPKTLKFHIGPMGAGKNNVVSATGAIIPLPALHYTSVYILQSAGPEAPYYTTATLNYANGNVDVTSISGSTSYGFGPVVTGGGVSGPLADEIIAFTVDHLNLAAGPAAGPANVYLRTIQTDPTRVLNSITFGGIGTGTGANTLSKGLLYGYSADTVDTVVAPGTISGTIKAPAGTPVKGAFVTYLTYRIVTDATGTYKFNGVPAGSVVITASKPANYAPLAKTFTVAPGQNVTGADIQFTAAIPVVSEPLSGPNIDVISSDANYPDFTTTGFMLGAEYLPNGFYSPLTPGSNTESTATFTHDANAPEALSFFFGPFPDTPVAPGDPNYTAGGTANAMEAQGSVLLAPQTKITNVYLATIGAEGSVLIAPILHYTDGTSVTLVKSMSDWFGSPTSDELPYILMHGRHARNGESNQSPSTNIRMNVITLAVNSAKQLRDVTFPESNRNAHVPVILGVSWETDGLQKASSDVKIVVTKSGSPAAGAFVRFGPYTLKADSTGTAIFRSVPAGFVLDAGAYLWSDNTKPGQVPTMQAHQEGITVGIGLKGASAQTINLALPATAPNYLPLRLAYDYDAISEPAEYAGDYKSAPGNDKGFEDEQLTFASDTDVVYGGVPYHTPFHGAGYNNTLRVNGQTIKVPAGHYSAFDVLVTGLGTGNVSFFPATLTYQDGSTEQVIFTSQDWVDSNLWATPLLQNQYLFNRDYHSGADSPFYGPNRRGGDGTDAAGVAFVSETTPVNAGRVLTSITFPPIISGFSNDDCDLMALTLESNDASLPAVGNITGKVTVTPAGGSTPGFPLQVQVKWDAGHAVYTDQAGNFTLPNVPLGAGTLTVIPYGTGVVSKSFPVTVVAGANNVGTLAVGAAAPQVYSVLGQSNLESGLHQVEGYDSPYGPTIGDSPTTVVTIGGKTGRQTLNSGSYEYFKVDMGWLFRGRQGALGLDPTTLATATPKIAPDLYMQIEYYDRGTDTFQVQYTKMETWANAGVVSYRMTNNYASSAATTVTKTNTNTWKTAVVHFAPAVSADPLGAYSGENLEADFRIAGQGGTGALPEIFRSVAISTTSTFTPLPNPVGSRDALRIAGGLQTLLAADKTALDVNGDGKVTLADAVLLAKQGK